MFLETRTSTHQTEHVRHPIPLRHEQKSIVELPEIELTVSARFKGRERSTADGEQKFRNVRPKKYFI